jgi:uncharacterized protein (TIGR00251 family)
MADSQPNPPLVLRATSTGTRMDLRIMPRSSKNGIDGVRNGRLVVRVTAPPVDSAANGAVIAVLANILDVPKHSVRIVSGATSRNKTVEITGLDEVTLHRRIPIRS